MKIERQDQLDQLRFDDHGLLPVVAQHATSGEVLMVAYANRTALERTLETRRLWLYSRSRQQLWQKGESSGNVQRLLELHADCDSDTILARVLPTGPACHTGARNCFGAAPTLLQLADRIGQRAGASTRESYTARLLQDANLRLKKLGEEATELALACQSNDAARVRAEAADLIYHVLVAVAAAGVALQDVLGELDDRFSAGAGARSQAETPPAEG
ncbi:MAG: bifunctional phosphoribosyl-AMP cyclohydrolase/phosphoribosyl-ATP diphosphatase HisIE [Longimicrobiales bacterium]